MRVLPINFNIYNQNIRQNNAQKIQNKNDIFVQKPDVVSFSGSAPNAEALRALLPYRIPDLYSPVILLDPAKLNEILNKRVFSRGLRGITKVVEPLTDSLFPVEGDFYALMRAKAYFYPNMRISQFVQSLVPEHEKLLRDAQYPIFKEIEAYSSDFPADVLDKFNYLMFINNKKINNEPVFLPFSIKDFKYKLNNIKKRIMAGANEEEKNAMSKLLSIAGNLQYIPKEQRLSSDFKLTKYEDKQKQMISQMLEYFSRSALKDDKDLNELLINSENRIFKVPINIRFNRKTFIYDLQKITECLEDRRLAHMVEKTAISLPTSKENLSAFIMKAAARSEDQIGYDMLSGSDGTVDHLVASAMGGKDSMSNYALSSAYKNSLKAHKSFSRCYHEDPNIAEYAQAQIDRLLFLQGVGIARKVKLDRGYIPHLAHRLEKLSKDPSFKIELYGL